MPQTEGARTQPPARPILSRKGPISSKRVFVDLAVLHDDPDRLNSTLAGLGVEGAIVGRAVYEGTVDLAEAVAELGGE
ncbi:MAG: hypothetical protein IID31_13885 [Planctomycetes bacterium]|nr:hypothetical protein [Planctomycetota bacterium]